MMLCLPRPGAAARVGLAAITFFFGALLAAVPARAQATKAAVDVVSTRSNLVRGPGNAGDNWLEFEVVLDVRATEAGRRFVDRVRVAPLLGFDLGSAGAPGAGGAGAGSGAGERRFAFYRAQAEAVTIENGRATFRFYLPPEVVKRDALREPKLFALELSAAGESVPLAKSHLSGAISSPDALATFRARGNAEAPVHDGILLPQYLTPFAGAYERSTPSFIRRESTR